MGALKESDLLRMLLSRGPHVVSEGGIASGHMAPWGPVALERHNIIAAGGSDCQRSWQVTVVQLRLMHLSDQQEKHV